MNRQLRVSATRATSSYQLRQMIQVENLSLDFGKRRVLNDISLSVDKSEILVVMGTSGGGKTTLLRCISGLLKPTEGTVMVNQIDVSQDPDAAREHIGLVFQYAALFDFLNVSDNILFGLRRRKKLSQTEGNKIVAQQLEDVGLADVQSLMPSELSGGMRKRVGLARALVLEPSVILYDEPTSGLDPVTAYSIDQLIVETKDRTGVTSVVVSHDVSSVMRVADRIAFLHQGELAFLGTTEEFLSSGNESIREIVEKGRAEQFLTRSM